VGVALLCCAVLCCGVVWWAQKRLGVMELMHSSIYFSGRFFSHI
jgi:hypothetical protein